MTTFSMKLIEKTNILPIKSLNKYVLFLYFLEQFLNIFQLFFQSLFISFYRYTIKNFNMRIFLILRIYLIPFIFQFLTHLTNQLRIYRKICLYLTFILFFSLNFMIFLYFLLYFWQIRRNFAKTLLLNPTEFQFIFLCLWCWKYCLDRIGHNKIFIFSFLFNYRRTHLRNFGFFILTIIWKTPFYITQNHTSRVLDILYSFASFF